MPIPRTEVAAARVGAEIMVFGGFEADGSASRRADAYSPARDVWRRLPDLPVGVHHSMAVGDRGKLYVLGGYDAAGVPLRSVFVLENGSWRALPRMPFPRAAAGAGLAGRRIVVAGGIGQGLRLARNALVFDLRTSRWSVVAGPTPREHLGVTALAWNGLRRRGPDGGPRHESPHLRKLPARRSDVEAASAGAGLTRRHGSCRARRSRRVRRRRGAGRDDCGGARVSRRGSAVGQIARSADAAAWRRSGCLRGPSLRYRRRPRARAHRELGKRSSPHLYEGSAQPRRE